MLFRMSSTIPRTAGNDIRLENIQNGRKLLLFQIDYSMALKKIAGTKKGSSDEAQGQ